MKKIGEPGWRPTEVHPLAAAFRMMTNDELAELAADIKANGLLIPIVIDDEGKLVDGRNRSKACDIAGVEPSYQRLNGHDAAKYIASANIHRRHLNKGMQAIGLARIYPEPEKGGRGKRSEGANLAESAGFSHRRLNEARSILRHSPELAEQVRDGLLFFDTALKEVSAAQEASQSREAKLARLRVTAPDVVALVEDERLSLEAGMAELAQRERATRQVITGAEDSIATIMAIAPHALVVRSLAALTTADLGLINLHEDDRKAVMEKLDIDALKAVVRDLEQIKRGRH